MASGVQRNRIYKLLISNPDGTYSDIESSLQVVVRTRKTSDHKHTRGNTGSVDIYNLPYDTYSSLRAGVTEVQAWVGYADADYSGSNLHLLLQGTCSYVSVRNDGVNSITSLEVGEGFSQMRDTVLSQVVPAGRTMREVVSIVAKAAGISVGSFTGENIDTPLQDPVRLDGSASDVLAQLSKAHHFEYQVNMGTLHVTDINGLASTNQTTAPVISPETGLYGFPYRTTDIPNKTVKDKTRRDGITFRCALNPELRPGFIVKLEYRTLTGFYRLKSVSTYADFRGNSWYCDCEATDIHQSDIEAATK